MDKIGKSDELIIANKELAFQNEEKEKRTEELIIVTIDQGQDITEQINSEKALKESQKKYYDLYENAPVGIYCTRIDGSKILEVNNTACEMLGFTKEEFLGQPSAIRWADPNRRNEILKILKEHGVANNFDADILKKDGSRISCLLSMKIYKDEGYIEGFIVDITERKRVEETLVKLKKVIYTSGEAIFLTDREGVFTFVNPAFTSLYGFSSEEIVGKTTPRIIKSGVLDKSVYEVFWQTLLNGDEVRGELMNKKKDGTLINTEGSATPIIDEEKNIIGFLGIQRDITERKLAEQELIKAKEKAEESDRLKSAFLSNMNHEIRTPMNGILGSANLLKEHDLTGEQQEYISIIEKCGAQMLIIINDIINISKIESGQMKISISETNVNEKTEYIYAFFKPEIDQKGLQFFLKNTLPAKEATIKTDREKVYAILTNLVKNAIKFTDKGSIEFGYNLKPAGSKTAGMADELVEPVETVSEPAELEFFVKDTGTGIRQEHKEIIFEKFRQGSESLNKKYEGAGLGLSISKAFVKMLGGNIWVESEEGKGSVFYFTIPYNVVLEEKNVI